MNSEGKHTAVATGCLFFFILLGLLSFPPFVLLSNATTSQELLDEAVSRAADVKAFEKTIGIEPSDALSASTRAVPGVSRLWIWLQKKGTLATRGPMDFVLQLNFSREREKVPLESIHHWHEMGGFSYYWRHSSEFESEEDASAITVDFATQPVRRQVEVVIHEDLHANYPFKSWPFRINEGTVTPLANLAALAFFRSRGDLADVEKTEAHIEEERKLSRELNGLVATMRRFFASGPLEPARKQALQAVEETPTYSRFFDYQVEEQSPDNLLEAKVSHDWAYYGLYEAVVKFYEQNGKNIEKLVKAFKDAPSGGADLDRFLNEIEGR